MDSRTFWKIPGISRMISEATDKRATRSISLATGVSYIMFYIVPQTKQSIRDQSGDCSGQDMHIHKFIKCLPIPVTSTKSSYRMTTGCSSQTALPVNGNCEYTAFSTTSYVCFRSYCPM
ncbi:hypothetical protein AVEN_65159-1 [Araneus ventricosus]|uniref:Uncharacterized protein n=1 Tax=Araneus ventricosus TaxID=182803 RepID=A0A4Y2AG29_ARAVE|nr:hypothetical protein AVEN_65159-1 [Araneus ventricosus]